MTASKPTGNAQQVFDLSDRTAWSGSTHARRRKYRRIISLAYLVSFRLGRWFPNSVPLVYVVGYPKSGTSWAAQLVAEYLRLPFPQHSIFPIGCPAVFQGHQHVDTKYPNGVYVVRDGRDVMISGYHHLKSQFLAGGGSRQHKKFFRSIDIDAPLSDNLCEFITHTAKHPFACRKSWGDHVSAYFEANNPNVHLLKYEDLIEDPISAMSTILERLVGQPANLELVEDSTKKFDFGRQPKKEASDSYLRKGKRGDWTNHFTKESSELFQSLFGQSLVKAGYEVDSQWPNSLSNGSTQVPHDE